MLKWTSSAQKLMQETTPMATRTAAARMPRLRATPHPIADPSKRRRERRATIANKENIPIFTSTPMVRTTTSRLRNSPLVLAPLMDILNVTPESVGGTPERLGLRRVALLASPVVAAAPTMRRHSIIGGHLGTNNVAQQYAATLPHFLDEEYSPSATAALPTGQQLALRGLLPDPFRGNARYFNTPELARQAQTKSNSKAGGLLPQRRKLEQEFVELADETVVTVADNFKRPKDADTNATATHKVAANTITATNSARMGDQTLDQLIDAILDSARKDEKKKKPRKSFNLRRRTLLRNQVESVEEPLLLSPSYAAGDDPASDLSFLLCEEEPTACIRKSASPLVPFSFSTENSVKPLSPATPTPATPLPGTLMPDAVLQQQPTPAAYTIAAASSAAATKPVRRIRHDSFMLATPPVIAAAQKRRKTRLPEVEPLAATLQPSNASKKFKVDARNYFELGVALPSIYV